MPFFCKDTTFLSNYKMFNGIFYIFINQIWNLEDVKLKKITGRIIKKTAKYLWA